METKLLDISVVNTTTRDGVYIGRKFAGNPASPLANPFPLAKGANDKARDRSIVNYKGHLNRAIDRAQDGTGSAEDWAICQELDRLVVLARQGPLQLRCWCAPKACHGEYIADLVRGAVRSGRVFCPDAGASANYCTKPQPRPCWHCGAPIEIPGLDWSKCSARCRGPGGWVETEKPARAKVHLTNHRVALDRDHL